MEEVLISSGDYYALADWYEDHDPGSPVRASLARLGILTRLLPNGLVIGTYAVTQSQYRQVMGVNHSHFSRSGDWAPAPNGMDTDDFPVESVSYHDATAFCTKLSSLTGITVRLPTEAEWEYACRAGTTTAFHYGDSLSSKQANFNGNYPSGGAEVGPCLGRPTKVGSYEPNAWGLYDMHGNVWEWCSPNEAAEEGSLRGGVHWTLRGGSWLNYGRGCRSALRYGYEPSYRDYSIGFRIATK